MFLVGNGLGLALALYKCQAMGLLPTRPSDWLAFVTPPQVCHRGSRTPGFPDLRAGAPPLTPFSLSPRSGWSSLGGA